MKLVWKLLRSNLSLSQLLGFLLANLVGLAIVLLGACLYHDVSPLLEGEESVFSSDYIVLSKPVGLTSVLTGGHTSFSTKEIEDLAAQDFVKEIGEFSAAPFSIYAKLSAGSIGVDFGTEMFFESVPDRFIDVDAEGWSFSAGDNLIPIIVPRDYLNLYNFGFSQGAGLPALSEKLIEQVEFDITLSGHGRNRQMRGRIAGFSDRLNTILVPQSFMDWARSSFGSGAAKQRPSRLIVEVKNPTDKSIAQYLDSHGYTYEKEKLQSSRSGWLLALLVGIVMAIGLVISALACYVLVLSLSLLLQKNMEKLRDLKLIGYSSGAVSAPYMWLSAGVNLLSFAGALALSLPIRSRYLAVLDSLAAGFETHSGWIPAALVAAFVLVVSSLHLLYIRRKIERI